MTALQSHLQKQITASHDFFWHRLRWRALSGYLPADRAFSLVDVGAGAGLLGEYMAAERPLGRYAFVEPLAPLEAHLESRYGKDANVREQAHYHGAGFVTLLDVLEHQADDRAFLAELTARLDVGATLVVTVPALNALWSEWDTALGHHRRYSARTLRARLMTPGLEPVGIDYLFPEMLAPAIARKLLRRTNGAAPEERATEFPDLPPLANAALYRIGLASLRLRGAWPAGTSLLAVARRIPDS